VSPEAPADPLIQQVLAGVESPWQIPFDSGLATAPDVFAAADDGTESDHKDRLDQARKRLKEAQAKLYAGKQFSVLLVFQAMDAAGKDGAIREVLEGLDPNGLRVSAFKRPSKLELEHDFLWRTTLALPERGIMGLFNRSYYEEVLTVKVHPEFLQAQYAGLAPDPAQLWPARYRAIREHEKHLIHANTLVMKFWLNVSPGRQARRFLERLQDPAKQWKFSRQDIAESELRSQYDDALKDMFNETSRPYAPWFCIPADDRWYARWQIADIVAQALDRLPMNYPEPENLSADEITQYTNVLADKAR